MKNQSWALKQTAKDSKSFVSRLNNFAVILGHRYEQMGNTEDLEEVIRVTEDIIKVMPEGHPDFAGFLNN